MLSILAVGVVGFMIIEEDTFLDSLYMTVITVSTVGFGEIHELSQSGKIFTIILIIISWLTFAYAVSVITSYFVEGEIGRFFKTFRNKTEIKKMKDHVIVVGFGRNGRQAARDLKTNNQPFVVIEQKHDLIANYSEEFTFLEGDATEDDTLMNAGIMQAKALVATLPIDADNLFVVLTAKSLNPKIKIVSRASQRTSERKLRVAGADHVVMPEKVGGEHMVELVVKPDVVEFLDNISLKGKNQTNLEEIMCSNLPEDMRNHTIYELGIRKKTGANIVGFKTPDGEYIINPTPDTLVIPNSKLFVLGTPEQIEKMRKVFNQEF